MDPEYEVRPRRLFLPKSSLSLFLPILAGCQSNDLPESGAFTYSVYVGLGEMDARPVLPRK